MLEQPPASPLRPPAPASAGLLAQAPTCLPAETPLDMALAHLASAPSAAVLAEAGGEFVGILTERTAVQLTLGGLQYERLLGEVCSQPLLWCEAAESYVDVYERMLTRGVRHALVRAPDGQLAGILGESAILDRMGIEHFAHLDALEQIMTVRPHTLPVTASVDAVARTMREAHVGCVIAVDEDDTPAGVITTHDITRMLAAREDLAAVCLAARMSTPVIGLEADRPVIEAAQLMGIHRIRHVVVTRAGRIAGILSQHDIVRCLEHRYVEVLRRMISRQAEEIDAHRRLVAQGNLLDQLLSRTHELGLCLIEPHGDIRFANAATHQMLDIDGRAELVDRDDLARRLDDDSRPRLAALLGLAHGEAPVTLRAGGRAILARACPLGSGDILLILVDEQVAAEAGEWLGFSRHAFGAMGLPLVWANGSGRITMRNSAFDTLVGSAADTPLAQDLFSLLDDAHDLTRHAQPPGPDIRKRTGLRRPDGTTIPVELFFTRVHFCGECYVGGFVHDLSAQTRMELALHDTEERLVALLETSPDFIAVKDPASRWQMANTAGLRMYGLEDRDWRGRTNDELAALAPAPLDDMLRRCNDTDLRAWSQREPIRFLEALPRRSAPGVRHLDMIKTPIFDPDGQPKALMVVGRDISARIAAEQARQAAAGRLHSALSGMDDLMLIVDADRVVRDHYPNPAPTRFPFDHGVLIGKSLDALLPSPAADHLQRAQAALAHGDDVQSFDYRVDSAKGAQWFNARISRHEHVEDGGRGMTLMVRDTTRARQTTEALEQLRNTLEARVSERTAELEAALSELETFSYSLSHDLRAPLRAISGFSRLLATEFGNALPAGAGEYMARIRTAVDRMDRLIDDMLDLARLSRKPVQRERIDLTHMAKRIAEELDERDATRRVRWDIQPGMMARADPLLLHSVLDNLLGNAWKFTRDATAPCVRVYTCRDGDPTAFIVEDNGAGFDMNYADQLFQPFQRLHSPREFDGNGIGLATVQRIIRRHGGTISGESPDQGGALFRFTLGH
ncbi:PAS domain-containing protein [Nitrogeniibacter mangrovi]|uniref:histidine kinase n=1 Tax=Nitrogeniibacter mangrovi TaxID=2016596 RepID=A0A6C1B1H0_9RHOO|nr:CBS domain-containing protein [Nitrogeniibacter mangrovi]QID17461.1 PAS domain-containing protein [Nitrogeniibacter mangrovi]